MVQRLNVSLLSKNQKIVLWSNALNDFCSVKIDLAEKRSKQLNQHLVLKELHRSDFLIAIEDT